jgi:hypothetical protein
MPVLDAAGIERLAAFCSRLAGWPVVSTEPGWITVRTPDGQDVAFQLAPDHIPPRWPGQDHPQQIHLGLTAGDDRAAASLGAGGDGFRVFTDPAGHPFCLTRPAARGTAE